MNQLQFTDSMTVLALIALGLGATITAVSAWSAYHAIDNWRRSAYLVGAGIGLYTAVAYAIVLAEPLATVAVLRPAIIAWMLHNLVVMRVMATVITTAPGEQARRELEGARHKISNLEQGRNIHEGIIAHYQEWHGDMKAALDALNEKYTGSNELVINLRHALTNMVDEQMKLKETLVRAKYRGNDRGGDSG
jgi:hypothetical protein